MKIISKFSDYYDHVAGWYGVDENGPVYARKPVEDRELTDVSPNVLNAVTDRIRQALYLDDRSQKYNMRLLVIVDRAWIVAHPDYPTDPNTPSFLWYPWVRDNPNSDKTRGWMTRDVTSLDGKQTGTMLQLAKAVGRPVFEVEMTRFYDEKRRQFKLSVVGTPPILSRIKGLASIYPAQQIYQDIEYGIVNLLNPSPDMAGPTAITNSEKIVSHGFDLVQSFRHRK